MVRGGDDTLAYPFLCVGRPSISFLTPYLDSFCFALLEELERLNMECDGHVGHVNRECSLVAVEARNILKVALASQAAMADEVRARVDRKSP